jgi:hypothetical protein
MKKSKVAMILLAAASVFAACSKGNEHLSRDVYTPLTTVAFDMPIITQVDTSQTILELETPLNLDSIVKNTAGANYGASDIKSIKLRSLRLDVLDFDTTYNFRLVDSLQLQLRNGTDTTTRLAQTISNQDFSSQTLSPTLSAQQPELKSFYRNSGFLYLITGRMRRVTTKPFRLSMTAQYKITVGD